jgi:hypothetical protein
VEQNQIDLLCTPVSVRYEEVRGHLQRLHLDACFSTFQVLVFCMFINAFL